LCAWEVTEEERDVFTQDAYPFQSRLPVVLSRYAVTLPPGWEAKGVIFNAGALDPQVSGNTYTWEMKSLPFRERERYSPGLSALVPRLAVTYFPPSGNRAGLQGLQDWSAVSTWLSGLAEPAAEPTEPIRAKAMQLTAGATTELDRVRAIAAFTQQTRYVEVSLNLARGGGYTPHSAQDTLARNYGDCKDKATLMRALLKAAGVESFLTAISADDRSFVRPEWPSPMQFNHVIVAVRVPDSVSLPTVLPATPLGRLLFFDPTDSITALGDLPQQEQGSQALVVSGARGALMTMPILPSSGLRRAD
jgi:transglutaminase-like putative cysteine protease